MKANKGFDSSLEKMAELIIKRMESVELDWKKPWVDPGNTGNPRNISGRAYNGWNRLMLILLGMERSYNLPVYMTHSQTRQYGAIVSKGEKGFPVCYVNYSCRNFSTGKTVEYEEYLAMDESQRAEYATYPYWKTYTVFNVDQTNLKEVCPDVYKTLSEPSCVKVSDGGEQGNPILDALTDQGLWICPIRFARSKGSCYSTSENLITMPYRESFICQGEYYCTLLHEMAHSTGVQECLSRDMNASFGTPKYAREELIAELSGAMEALNLGVTSTIQDNNVAYLQNWIRALRWQPDFLKMILPEVERCVSFMDRKIHEAVHEAERKTVHRRPVAYAAFCGDLFR